MILLAVLLAVLNAGERRLFEEAISLHLASNLVAAERDYRALLETRPDFAPAGLYRAEALWLLGRRDQARDELESARSRAAELLLFRFLERSFGGSDDSPVVEKLLRAYPLEQNGFLATGTPTLLLLSMGDASEAIEDYERAARLDPGDATMHRQLGSAFTKSRLWAPAVAAFQRVVSVAGDDVAAWQKLGSGNLVLHRWGPAIAAFERALALGGEEPGVLLALGYAHERTPDFERALELYRRAAALAPSWAQPHYRMGRALLASGRLEQARAALETSYSLDPKFPEPLAFLGEIHLKRGETAVAIETLERAVAVDAELFEAYYHLAQAYRRAGRDADAQRAISRYAALKSRKRDVPSQEEALARAGERERER